MTNETSFLNFTTAVLLVAVEQETGIITPLYFTQGQPCFISWRRKDELADEINTYVALAVPELKLVSNGGT